jgi:hypothetical protein
MKESYGYLLKDIGELKNLGGSYNKAERIICGITMWKKAFGSLMFSKSTITHQHLLNFIQNQIK